MYVSNRQVRWRRTKMTKEILKEKACAAIDAYADKIKAICASINDEPELGFKEVKTAAKVAEFMRDLGLEPQTGLAINGVKGRAKGGKPGPTAAVLGERQQAQRMPVATICRFPPCWQLPAVL